MPMVHSCPSFNENYFQILYVLLTSQAAKECTSQRYHAIQKSCFPSWQVKLLFNNLWCESTCRWEVKVLQADTQCNEDKWKVWKQFFCCLGKIFELGVASGFVSFFCFFFIGLRKKKNRDFRFKPSIPKRRQWWRFLNRKSPSLKLLLSLRFYWCRLHLGPETRKERTWHISSYLDLRPGQ